MLHNEKANFVFSHGLTFKARYVDWEHVLYQNGSTRYIGVLTATSTNGKSFVFVHKLQKQVMVAEI